MSPWTTFASPTPPEATRRVSPSNTPISTRWWQALWSRRDGRLHSIRQFMLMQLASVEDNTELAGQISAASDPQELWALREPLRLVLMEAHGELLARQRMTDVSFMFAGLLQERNGTRRDAGLSLSGWSEPTAVRASASMHTEH